MNDKDLDDLLGRLQDVPVPQGLSERIISDAPDAPPFLTERPDFWNKFFKPIFAGPGLAATMIIGITVGYASASTSTVETADFSYAFDYDESWVDSYSDEATE